MSDLLDRMPPEPPITPAECRGNFVGYLRNLALDDWRGVNEAGRNIARSPYPYAAQAETAGRGFERAYLESLESDRDPRDDNQELQKARVVAFGACLRAFAHSGLAVPADSVLQSAQMCDVSDERMLGMVLTPGDVRKRLGLSDMVPSTQLEAYRANARTALISMGLIAPERGGSRFGKAARGFMDRAFGGI